MSDNSRINKQSSALAEEAADRAVARKQQLTKVFTATDGSNAAVAEKDKAKGNLAVDPASDLKPRK